MSAISTVHRSAGLSEVSRLALGEARSAAHAKATITSLPVSASINALSQTLDGITLTLGGRSTPVTEVARPEAPNAANDDAAAAAQPAAPGASRPGTPAKPVNTEALRAARHYTEIEATTKTSGDMPDGRLG